MSSHDPTVCERCGRLFNNKHAYRSHFAVCQAVIPPADMVEMILADSDLTVEALSWFCGVSKEFIRQHLLAGGLSGEEIADKWTPARRKKKVLGRKRCSNCEIFVIPPGDTMPEKWSDRVNSLVYVGGVILCYGCAVGDDEDKWAERNNA